MTAWDIAILIIIGIFTVIGIVKGFLRTLLGFGAWATAIIIARIFGARLGESVIPELIHSDGILGGRLSSSAIDSVNRSLAASIGTLIVFALLYLLLRLLARALARVILRGRCITLIDRLLGAILGLAVAAGVIFALVLAFDAIAAVVTLIAPDSDMYGSVENTSIFKYFFDI